MKQSQLCLRLWQSTQPYPGDPQKKLREHVLFKKIIEDDRLRGNRGEPILLNRTKRELQAGLREAGIRLKKDTTDKRIRKGREVRGPPVDLLGLDEEGLSPILCRKLIRKGITALTETQQLLIRNVVSNSSDMFLSSYTGSGKSFGACLALCQRMIDYPPTEGFTYLILLPTVELCYQFKQWLIQLNGSQEKLLYVAKPETDIKKTLKALDELDPYTLITVPDELQRVIQSSSASVKKSMGRFFKTNTKTVLSKIRDNSQLVILDEVDSLFPTDNIKLLKNRKMILSQILRIEGGKVSTAHSISQQQVLFISATLSHSARSTLSSFVNTSLFSEKGAPGRSEQKEGLTLKQGGDFPEGLYHGFISVADMNEVFESLRIAVQIASTRQWGCILKNSEGQQYNESNFIGKMKIIVFVKDDVVDFVNKKLNEILPQFKIASLVGNETNITETTKMFEESLLGTNQEMILVVPKSSVRGLDFVSVTHVFIIGLPPTTADYIHLSGRTARNGSEGCCTTIITTKELPRLRFILERCFVPTVQRFEHLLLSKAKVT